MHTARFATEEAVFPTRPAAVPFLSGLKGQQMKPTYKEQLLDPRWQRKRLERLNLSDFTCDACGDKENTLHVHHRRYFKGRMAWEYTLEELQTLCKQCHSDQHLNEELFKTLLQQAEETRGITLLDVTSLLGGFLYGSLDISDSEEVEGLRGTPYWDAGIALSVHMGDSREIVRDCVRAGLENPAQYAELLRWDEHEAHYLNGSLAQLYGSNDA